MGFVETSGELEATTRIRRNTVWDVIQFTANGIIFVLLGEQLPAIMAGAADTVRLTGHHEPWWLALYVVAINLGLAALRFMWVWLSLRLTLFRTGQWRSTPNWRTVAAMSFAGVRGAITLAGVLTLPLIMNDGSPFPARDLAIFLAMGVIIVSLIVASLGLPWLLRDLEIPAEDDHQAEIDVARIKAAEAAIAEIEKVQHALAEGRSDADLYVSAASRLMDAYRHRIESRVGNAESNALERRTEEVERRLRLAALKAERTQIFRMVRNRELGSEPARKLIREIDLLEARYATAT
jgi:CPA1 family monovalent cation:H+ antiporter